MDDINVFQQFLKDVKHLKDLELQHVHNKRCSPNKGRTINKVKRRRPRFNPLEEMNEIEFRKKYRYTKENMRRIIEIVRDDLEVDYYAPMKRNQVPIDLQILSAIRFFGGTEHPHLSAMAHGVSLHTMAKITRRVAAVLSSKASSYIRMPATLSEKERMMRSFQSLSNMPQVIGALVQTTVRLQLDSSRVQASRSCYSGTESPAPIEELVHLQVVADAEHKIRDLDIRLSEELDLSTAPELFSLSRIKERFEQNEFRGRILLGNDSLSCSPCLFTPVQYPKTKSEDLYNHAHAITFAPAIKCLNVWMRRFGILGSELLGTFGSAKQTITALAVLHNMAMEWNDPSIDADSCVSVYKPNFLSYAHGTSTIEEQRNRNEFIKSHFSTN
ncbi:putative nuclease HARBI1 isoform X1 [Drosophila novamexicana]|uniref:putative nuclease HARBI1 isoform X1 n=1 Tax=Drosophila novamexicana TaxID=47314 RepID=UPI0011E5AB73|nr:putative nuclease HARBI1 isoform X1 [Drosophila novamexicana]